MRHLIWMVFALPSAKVMWHGTVESGFRSPSRPSMLTTSSPFRPSDLRVSPPVNSNGITPMPTRLERWIRSNDSAITALTPNRAVPFAAQSRDEPAPYSMPPKITSGVPAA
ncbi:MAG: hypothetical protein ACD_54C00619G0001 [uncultured bacterium]|nr:MAG: hypothetical protein ACD_54C00619G0001 [uncultured bacterium]